MLDKRLQLGGLQVGGPRTAQNPARFRVANNVYQTRDDVYVPRKGNVDFLSLGAGDTVVGTAVYKKKIFAIVESAGALKFYYDSATELPSSVLTPVTVSDLNDGIQFSEKRGCLFFNIPNLGLHKFDGAQVYRAGVPLPYIGCTEFDSAGTTFIRVIQHHIDFQGNQVASGYVEFPVTPSGSSISIRTDKGAPDVLDPAFDTVAIKPLFRPALEKLNGSFDEYYFINPSSPTISGSDAIIPTGGDHHVAVGAYLMVSHSEIDTGHTGFSEKSYAVAIKVKAFDATTVTLDLSSAKYMDASRTWKDVSISPTSFLATSLLVAGSNLILTVWSSNAATGNYVFKDWILSYYNASTSKTINVDVSSPTSVSSSKAYELTVAALNLAGNLGDIYDVTTVKSIFPFGDSSPAKSFTTYNDMALIAYANEIYFSDTTQGGAFEMVNGLSFIVVGEEKDGEVQSVCGNEDFLLVSRRFANFFVSGNLPTANYRPKVIPNAPLGAYSASASMAIGDKIIFFTKQGVWALYFGGRCEEVSENIKELFTNYSATTDRAEEAYFDISDLPDFASDEVGGRKWVRVRWDTFRNLVFFLKGDGQALVLNMNNGEFYTWDGISNRAEDISFVSGLYYVADYDSGNVSLKQENLSDITSYQALNPSTLTSTWLTVNEPSLEKKGAQVKLWGLIVGAIGLGHYLDWAEDMAEEISEYTNTRPFLLSHKKRTNTASFLAYSFEIRLNENTTKFELEGAEIEHEPIQEGMKR